MALNARVVAAAVDCMSMLQFFPSQPGTRKAIIELIEKMCSNDDQVKWLSDRVVNLFDEWPGPHELRAVLCSKFRPKDGIEADSKHSRYVEEGIPPEREQILPPPPAKRITAAESSADSEMQSIARQLAEKAALRR